MVETIEIDLGGPRLRGRAAKPLSAVVVRPLTPSDLDKLKVERGIKPPALQRIRDNHHFLARYLALGSSPAEASAVTGYSTARISILLGDPSFQELLSFYRDNRNQGYLDMKQHAEERMLANMLTAEAKIAEAFEESDQSVAVLNRIATDRMDRLGFGPTSKTQSVNVQVDGNALQAMKERLEKHLATRDLGALEFKHQQGGDALPVNACAPILDPAPVSTVVLQADATAGEARVESPRLGVSDDDRR